MTNELGSGSAPAGDENDLTSAIADVYGGRLEDFVRRRDALAKELRSSGKAEPASAVKALRKPSRLAWALDLAAQESRHVLDALSATVARLLDAQAAGGDVRAALADLRAVVRQFASEAARHADEAGHRLESAVLANAVLAVLGTPDSFDALRRGCLADVPEAGGLDFLASLSTLPVSVPHRRAEADRGAAVAAPARDERAEREAAARAAAQRAAEAVAAARARTEAAQRALREAESKVNAAEARLRQAEAEASAAREQRERARAEADAGAAALLEAEREFAETERRLESVATAGDD